MARDNGYITAEYRDKLSLAQCRRRFLETPAERAKCAWNRGLTKETDLRVVANAIAISAASKGCRGHRKGLTNSIEHRQRISEGLKRHYASHGQDCACIPTAGPSKLAWDTYDLLLKDFEVVIPEARFGPYSVDFLLAEEWLGIEIDGSYWHEINGTDYIARDEYLLSEHGLPIVRLTEEEIRANLRISL